MATLKEFLKNRPPVTEKWAEVRDVMATHLWGKPPERIFKTRRPLESSNEYALTYRIENFQPITKQPFSQAVAAILETVNHIFVDFKNVDDNTKQFVEDYRITAAGRTYDLDSYIKTFTAKQVESDPNAVMVVLPKHPTEVLIPDFREELPNFNNVVNQFVGLEVMVIPSSDVHFISDTELWYTPGVWVYDIEKDGKEKTENYYYVITADATRLVIPYKTKDGFDYRFEDYYANALDNPPFDVIGNSPVQEDVNGEMVEYQESHYAGAVAIGNDCLGVKSDADIINTRFTYPEKYMHMERCTYPGCVPCSDPKSPYNGLFVNWDYTDENSPSCTTCKGCNGSGQVAPDTSPLGTHFVAKSDVWDEHGKFTPLIGFVTPDMSSPEYMTKLWNDLFDQMEDALFLMRQNMTNQSGESKSYDWRQKVTLLTKATRNIYGIYENVLNAIQGFLRGDEDIEVMLPPDMSIKSTQDITLELGEAVNTSSLYVSQLTRELILKKFGNTATNRRIVDFLSLNDLLFGMNTDEVLKTVISYPVTSRARLQAIHDKGFAILERIARDANFESISDEQLSELFNAELDKIVPVSTPISPIA